VNNHDLQQHLTFRFSFLFNSSEPHKKRTLRATHKKFTLPPFHAALGGKIGVDAAIAERAVFKIT
jgi:hypothetical protein